MAAFQGLILVSITLLMLCLENVNGQSCPPAPNVAQMCVSGTFTGSRVLIDMASYTSDVSNCTCTYTTTSDIIRLMTYMAPNYPSCNSAIRIFSTSGNNMRFECLMSGTYLDTSIHKEGTASFEVYGEPYDKNYCLVLEHAGGFDDSVTITCTGPDAVTTAMPITTTPFAVLPGLVDNETSTTIDQSTKSSNASVDYSKSTTTYVEQTAATNAVTNTPIHVNNDTVTVDVTTYGAQTESILTTPLNIITNDRITSAVPVVTETKNDTIVESQPDLSIVLNSTSPKNDNNHTDMLTTTTLAPHANDTTLFTEVVTGTILLNGKSMDTTKTFHSIDLVTPYPEANTTNTFGVVANVTSNDSISFVPESITNNTAANENPTVATANDTTPVITNTNDIVMAPSDDINNYSFTTTPTPQTETSASGVTTTNVTDSPLNAATDYLNITDVLNPVSTFLSSRNESNNTQEPITMKTELEKNTTATSMYTTLPTIATEQHSQESNKTLSEYPSIDNVNNDTVISLLVDQVTNTTLVDSITNTTLVLPVTNTTLVDQVTNTTFADSVTNTTLEENASGITTQTTGGPPSALEQSTSSRTTNTYVTTNIPNSIANTLSDIFDQVNKTNGTATDNSSLNDNMSKIFSKFITVPTEPANIALVPTLMVPVDNSSDSLQIESNLTNSDVNKTNAEAMLFEMHNSINAVEKAIGTSNSSSFEPRTETVNPFINSFPTTERNMFGNDAIAYPTNSAIGIILNELTTERIPFGNDAIVAPTNSAIGMISNEQTTKNIPFGNDAIAPSADSNIDTISNASSERITFGNDAIAYPTNSGMDTISNEPTTKRIPFGNDAIEPPVNSNIDIIANASTERIPFGNDAIAYPTNSAIDITSKNESTTERIPFGKDAIKTHTNNSVIIESATARIPFGNDAFAKPTNSDIDILSNASSDRIPFGNDAIARPNDSNSDVVFGNVSNEPTSFGNDSKANTAETVVNIIVNETTQQTPFGNDAIAKFTDSAVGTVANESTGQTLGNDAITKPIEYIADETMKNSTDRIPFGNDAIVKPTASEPSSQNAFSTDSIISENIYNDGLITMDTVQNTTGATLDIYQTENVNKMPFGNDAIQIPTEKVTTITPSTKSTNVDITPNNEITITLDNITDTSDSVIITDNKFSRTTVGPKEVTVPEFISREIITNDAVPKPFESVTTATKIIDTLILIDERTAKPVVDTVDSLPNTNYTSSNINNANDTIPMLEASVPEPEMAVVDLMAKIKESNLDSVPTKSMTTSSVLNAGNIWDVSSTSSTSESLLKETIISGTGSFQPDQHMKNKTVPKIDIIEPALEVTGNALDQTTMQAFDVTPTKSAAIESLPEIFTEGVMTKQDIPVMDAVPTKATVSVITPTEPVAVNEHFITKEDASVMKTVPVVDAVAPPAIVIPETEGTKVGAPAKEADHLPPAPTTVKPYDVVMVDDSMATSEPNPADNVASSKDGTDGKGENQLNVAFGNESNDTFFDMNSNTYIIVVACISGLVVIAAILGIVLHHSRRHRSDKADISSNGAEPISHKNVAYDNGDVENGDVFSNGGAVTGNGAESHENGTTKKAENYKGSIEA